MLLAEVPPEIRYLWLHFVNGHSGMSERGVGGVGIF